MAAALTIAGVDLTAYVDTWGTLEQVKSILLAQATLFTSSMRVELVNYRGFGAVGGAAGTGLFAGVPWYDKPFTVAVDGVSVFEGRLRNVAPNPTKGTVAITAENVLRRPAETSCSLVEDGLNPAEAALTLLRQVLEDDVLDAGAFHAAAASFAAAGATVNVSIPADGATTILQALQSLQELASLSIFASGSRITCRRFKPYQGADAGLKFEITDAIVREWGGLEADYVNFNNRVRVGYPTAQEVVQDDARSQVENNMQDRPRSFSFVEGAQFTAANKTSARYFATLYLGRAAFRRRKVKIAGGKEFAGIMIGDRFPVTKVERMGVERLPMEAIEVRRSLDSNEVELALAELPEPAA